MTASASRPAPAPRPAPPLEPLRVWRWAALPWLVHGLVFGSFQWASNYFRGGRVTLAESILLASLGSAIWLLATPLVVALARRTPLTRRRFLPGALRLVAAGAALHLVIACAQYPLVLLRLGARWHVPPPAFFADWSITDLIRFSVVVFASKTIDGWRAARAARRRAQRLRAELAEAELELLHLRLQPHFLFNALSALSELVHVDPARADQALVALGDLLRRGLATSGRPVVPLAEELEALAAYLALERIRGSRRLEVTTDVEPRALAMGVPNFALQPIVENALRHGLAGRDAGRIRLTARLVDGDGLEIVIEDDGAGLSPVRPRAAGGGMGGRGLANVRERLARLHGGAAALVLEPGAAGGTVARLTLPARPAAGPATGPSAAPDEAAPGPEAAWSA